MKLSFKDLAVAVVGPIPPPSGGMANQARALVDNLKRDGATVEFVAVNRPTCPAFIGRIPVLRAVVRLPLYCLDLWLAIGRSSIVHVLANSGMSWHLYAAPAIWIAVIKGRPIVLNYRGGLAESFFARSWRWVKISMDRVDAVAVPSDFLQSIFARYGISAVELPNIVDLDFFDSSVQQSAEPRIVITRNLEELYGIDTALRAFAIVLNNEAAARLVVAGEGPELDNLVELSESLGISGSVSFVGRLGRAEIAELYQSATVVLNPSRVDNSPNSLIEAMAARRPIVTTNAGGIPDMLLDGVHGLIVAVDDVAAMADRLLTVSRDNKLSSQLVKNAYGLVQKYSWTTVGGTLLDLYSVVFEKRRGAR